MPILDINSFHRQLLQKQHENSCYSSSRLSFFGFIAFSFLSLSGCSIFTAQHAITDAALGGGGVGLGYALGGTKGAAIGGGAGILTGEAINYFSDKKTRDAHDAGYVQGRSDEVKTLYWAQRNFISPDNGQPKLRHKLVEIPVPAHYDSDGQYIAPSTQIVEVVN